MWARVGMREAGKLKENVERGNRQIWMEREEENVLNSPQPPIPGSQLPEFSIPTPSASWCHLLLMFPNLTQRSLPPESLQAQLGAYLYHTYCSLMRFSVSPTGQQAFFAFLAVWLKLWRWQEDKINDVNEWVDPASQATSHTSLGVIADSQFQQRCFWP